jgi:hypothetical protein
VEARKERGREERRGVASWRDAVVSSAGDAGEREGAATSWRAAVISPAGDAGGRGGGA